MNENIYKKIILFDLDGVLNNYNGNYDKNIIPPIKQGAYELIKELVSRLGNSCPTKI